MQPLARYLLDRYQDPCYFITVLQGPGQDRFTSEYEASILAVTGLRYQRTCIKDLDPSLPSTVIRFVSISAKFGICTIVGLNWTLVEAKIRIWDT